MQEIFRKSLVIGIILLFFGASIAPVISGKINSLELGKKTRNNISEIPDETMSMLTFHTFGENGEEQCEVGIPTEVANDIYDKLEDLKYMIVYEPKSDETQALKSEFVDILDANCLIPAGLSKDYVLSLLNPSWLNDKQKSQDVKTKSLLLNSFKFSISEKIFYLLKSLKNPFGKKTFENILTADPSTIVMSLLCSVGSGGEGIILPLFFLPRPRVIAMWISNFAYTIVGEFFTAKGFAAGGTQTGSMIGFTGIGLTYAFPDRTVYGFAGYALTLMVSAQYIEILP